MNIIAFSDFYESFQRIIKPASGFRNLPKLHLVSKVIEVFQRLCSLTNCRYILNSSFSHTQPMCSIRIFCWLLLQKIGRIKSLLLPSCLASVTTASSQFPYFFPYCQSQVLKHHPGILLKCQIMSFNDKNPSDSFPSLSQ